MGTESEFLLRPAKSADIPALRRLHARSWSELGGRRYNPRQIAGIMADIQTVDPDLIGDGTYYVIEHAGQLVASGGWTTRVQAAHDEPAAPLPFPRTPTSATIRAVFTAPSHARRGLARKIMEHAENRATIDGKVERIKLLATLSGLPLYEKIGYVRDRSTSLSLSNGETFAAVFMSKASHRGWVCGANCATPDRMQLL